MYMDEASYMYEIQLESDMKKTAFALAAILALSGAAFAGEASKTDTLPAACSNATLKAQLDCKATGSIDKTAATSDASKASAKPRLGIDVNPWIMPSTF